MSDPAEPAWGHDQMDPADQAAPVAGAPSRPRVATPVVALLVAVGVAALGGPLGLLWSELAPRLRKVKFEGDLYFINAGPEELAAADGWFMLLGIGTGIVVAAATWLGLRRHRGPEVIVGLAVGSLAASWIAARIGESFGREEYNQQLQTAPDRTLLTLPLELGATGTDVLGHLTGATALQALTTVFLYMIFAGWSKYPELRPSEPGQVPYQPAWRPDAQLDPNLTGSSEMGTGTART